MSKNKNTQKKAKKVREKFLGFTKSTSMEILQGKITQEHLFEIHYPKFLSMMEKALKAFRESAPNPVACKIKCDACCHHLIGMAPIEAAYIWYSLKKNVSPEILEKVEDSSNKAHKFEFQVRNEYPDDPGRQAIKFQSMNIPCPLLKEDKTCMVYDQRPMICRYHCVISNPKFCYVLNPKGQKKVWQDMDMMRENVMFQRFLSHYYLQTDQMGTLNELLIKFK